MAETTERRLWGLYLDDNKKPDFVLHTLIEPTLKTFSGAIPEADEWNTVLGAYKVEIKEIEL